MRFSEENDDKEKAVAGVIWRNDAEMNEIRFRDVFIRNEE